MRGLLALTWAAALFGQQDARSSRATAEDIAAGAKTFRSHCATCHGLHGEGGRGPNLAAGPFYHGNSDAELLANISDGIPGTEMPGIFYTTDRLRQIVAYIRSLNTAAERPAGDAGRGAALFGSKGCVRCHRVGGQGGRLGPDLSEIGKSRPPEHLRESVLDPDAQVQPRYWVASLRDASGARVQGYIMNEDTYTLQLIDMSEDLRSFDKVALTDYTLDKHSRMPSYRGTLNNGELNDLVAYLSSLRPE
jgi:putative heme-binding domain-containing protein